MSVVIDSPVMLGIARKVGTYRPIGDRSSIEAINVVSYVNRMAGR